MWRGQLGRESAEPRKPGKRNKRSSPRHKVRRTKQERANRSMDAQCGAVRLAKRRWPVKSGTENIRPITDAWPFYSARIFARRSQSLIFEINQKSAFSSTGSKPSTFKLFGLFSKTCYIEIQRTSPVQLFRTIYRRNLPHYQPRGVVLFLTYRLIGSLPKQVLHNLKIERIRAERQIANAFSNHYSFSCPSPSMENIR